MTKDLETTEILQKAPAFEGPHGRRPLVSAIVSTYNSEAFIRGCLEDLEAQTLRDRLEIIVIDSHSPQNERQIVAEFQERFDNITYVRTMERESVYKAWNRGIRLASGTYVTNANTDDRHDPTAFERMVELLESDPEVMLVYADQYVTDEANVSFEASRKVSEFLRPDFHRDIMLTGCHMGSQPMWRRAVHEAIGYFDERFTSASDYEFWCRMALRYPMARLPMKLGAYYRNPNGIEISNPALSIRETESIKAMYAPLFMASADAYRLSVDRRFKLLLPSFGPTQREFMHAAIREYLSAFSVGSPVLLVLWLNMADEIDAIEALVSRVCQELGFTPDAPFGDIEVVLSETPGARIPEAMLDASEALIVPQGYGGEVVKLAAARDLPVIHEPSAEHLRALAEAWDPDAIDIVLLTHNRLDYLKQTIEALYARTSHAFRLLVVDNASDSEVQEFLSANRARFHRVIRNPENRWTQAFTQGIGLTRSDPFIVSDPDILVPDLAPCWLERQLDLMERHPEMGMVALNLDPSNKPARLPDVYVSEKSPHGPDLTLSYVGTVMQTIRRAFYLPPYTTDWHAVEAITGRGGLVGFANHSRAYHLGWDEDRDYPDHLLKKSRYFSQNYGSDVYQLYTEDANLLNAMAKPVAQPEETNYYAFSRPEIQALVPLEATRILDVGCASGALGRALKARQACHVSGIEYVPEVAAQARRYLDEVISGDAVEAMEGMPSAQFDCIIFADVLEHLVEPERCLEQARRLLAPGGTLVASIPNVRHWSVVRDLLEGRWDYQDAGILDRTHLRFYTRESMLRMFKAAGFQVNGLSGTIVQGAEVPRGLSNALKQYGVDTASLDVEGQVYQFLLTASVSEKRAASKLTSIVLLGYNQLALTKLCIDSVLANTDAPFELILVDNGSTDGTGSYFKALAAQDPRIKVVLNAKNLGFALGCNQGIAMAQGDYVLFLNNDTLVPKDWLGRMLAPFQQDSQIGAVGAVSNCVSGPQQLPSIPFANHPNAYAEMLAFAEQRARSYAGRGFELGRLVGFCLLVRRDVLDMIGGFDPQFGIGNFEDDDLCLRIRTAGFRTWVAEDAYVHHFGSQTFAALGAHVFEGTMDEGWERFKAKWGLAPHLDRRNPYRVDIPKFDKQRHFVPLPAVHDPAYFAPQDPFQPETAPMELAERRHVAFFHHPVWAGSAWQEVVIAYVRAFTAEDEVSLVLWLDPVQGVALEDASRRLLDLLASLPSDPDHAPDLVLVPDVLDLSGLASLYAGVDCVVPGGDAVQQARATQMGRKLLTDLSPEKWQEILQLREAGQIVEA